MARALLIAGMLAPLLMAAPAAFADSEADQLRAQLKATVLQLRQLQDQQASAPPPAAAAAAPSSDDAKKLAATRAQLASARRAAAKVTLLQADLDKAEAENAALKSAAAANAAATQSLKTAFDQSQDADRALLEERGRLRTDLAAMTAYAKACQAKNTKLEAFGESMLQAYRRVSLGSVLALREPVLGLKRVQFENIEQDREDDLRENRCGAPPVTSAAPAPVRPGGG
jgi:hypothetical protein